MEKKERNGVNEINKVCKAVLKLKDEDFSEMETVIRNQLAYNHPLKMATARWQGELAGHNGRVLEALRNLKTVIEGGATIQKP
jgi:hypothetical protein